MKVELRQQFRIESARHLPFLPEGHPCRRLHGHSFQLTFRLVGEVDPKLGWLRDYHEISKTLEPLLAQLDHRLLNEVAGLENPTSENLARWIFERAQKLVPELVQVFVSETPNTDCRYPAWDFDLN